MSSEPEPRAVALVDDDADIRRLAEIALDHSGSFACVAAGSAREALERMGGRRFYALLVDMHLPDGDGATLLGELRARGTTGPAIFLTGDASEAARRRATEAGAIATITKPFDPLDLARLVSRAIGRASLEERMRVLRVDFGRRLPERVATLLTVAPAARDGADASWEALREDIHRLRGTCANYGYERVGRVMAELDERMVDATTPAARVADLDHIVATLSALDLQPG